MECAERRNESSGDLVQGLANQVELTAARAAHGVFARFAQALQGFRKSMKSTCLPPNYWHKLMPK